jgi:hypothetical protein
METNRNQITSEKYKDNIVKELEFVIKKMDQASTTEAKLYYFSAVQGILNRVLNLEYTEDLLLAFFVTNETLKAFQQRHGGFKGGDIALRLIDEQLLKLSEVTKELLEVIRNDGSVNEVIRKYVVLLYSTTGNGNYLMEKGVLKI